MPRAKTRCTTVLHLQQLVFNQNFVVAHLCTRTGSPSKVASDIQVKLAGKLQGCIWSAARGQSPAHSQVCEAAVSCCTCGGGMMPQLFIAVG